jgi:competence protein ComEC
MPAAGVRAGQAALCFCIGAIAAAAVPSLPPAPVVVLLAAIALLPLCVRRLRPLAGVPLGAAWFLGHALWLDAQRWPAERFDETVTFAATVIGLPEQRDGRVRVLLRPASAARARGLPHTLLLSWYRPLEWFRPGERWRITARLEPPRGRVNPGLFDYGRWLFARGIGATGRIVAADRLAAGGWRGAPDRVRQRFADWLQAETADLDAAALMRALTVADRSAMSPELSEALRRTGTAHLLSISGLHVGMVAGLAGLLAALAATPFSRWLGGFGRRRVALLAGLAAAGGYAALAGFTLPTVRALVMLAAGFGALLWRRPIQPGRALLLALTLLLLVDPMSPLSVGFWLSFGAVAVLVWAFAGRSRGRSRVVGLVRAQVVIAVGLLPLNLGIFGQWAPTALAANLVAIPLVGFWVLPSLLAALALFALDGPAQAFVAVAERGLALFLALLDRFMVLDANVAALGLPARPPPDLAAMALGAIGALWLLAPRGWPLRAAGAVLLLPLVWPPQQPPRPGEFDLQVVDVGDGHAVLVRTATQAWLYGTGPGDGAGRSLVPGTLAPTVRQTGIRNVARIVVPFDHLDYAGGVAEARAQWPGADVVAPGEGCVAGRVWRVDGVTFRVLHPSAALPDLGGDSSCVLEVRAPSGSALLTGGIGAAVGRRLAGRAGPLDIVLLPRGGHAEALRGDWLEALSPRLALATVSRYNRFGLPHQRTRKRTAALGTPLLTTGECGAIRIAFRMRSVPAVTAQRTAQPRFWRPRSACAR